MRRLIFILLLISVLAIGCTQLSKKIDTTVDADTLDNEQTIDDNIELEEIEDLGLDELDIDEDLEEDLDEMEDSLDFDF